MLVADAVTIRQGIGGLLVGLIVLYLGLMVATGVILRAMSSRWRRGLDPGTPYGPPDTDDGDGDDAASTDGAEGDLVGVS